MLARLHKYAHTHAHTHTERDTHTTHTHTHTHALHACMHAQTHSPFPFKTSRTRTYAGRTSSEAHRVGDSYHRPATHVSLLAASVSVPVVVRDCW